MQPHMHCCWHKNPRIIETCVVQAGTYCCWHMKSKLLEACIAQAGTLVALRTRAAPPPAGGGDEDDDLAAAIAASLADAGAAAPDGAAPAGERGGGGEDADLELARAIAASMGDSAAWQARRPGARRGRGRRCWTGRACCAPGCHRPHAGPCAARRRCLRYPVLIAQAVVVHAAVMRRSATSALQTALPARAQGAAARASPGVVVLRDPGPEPAKGPGAPARAPRRPVPRARLLPRACCRSGRAAPGRRTCLPAGWLAH